MPTYTYDLSTPVGQTRFCASDTNVAGQGDTAAFSDEELQYCLAVGLGDPRLAAAAALDAAAVDAAKMAVMLKTESTATDLREMASALASRAANLRSLSAAPPVIAAPCPVFSTDAPGVTGTMDGW